MNNKSNKKNRSLQKGLFFAISSELEKAIGRRQDWEADAEPDAPVEWVSPWSDKNKEEKEEAQKRVEEQRKRYADRFGSGEVSDSEFEEDKKNPVKYIPKPGDSPQAVRTEDELKDLRAGAKLTRDQTYGTKGKEPKRANELQEIRDKFREGKNLDTKEGRDKLTPEEKKEYAEKLKEQYTPEKKKQRADESAEDRVWRNLKGGMTAESFANPEDQEAYKRIAEKYMRSKTGKAAIERNKDAQEARDRGEETPKYDDPARTSNPYSSDRRDRVRIVRESARTTDPADDGSKGAGPKPVDPKPADPAPAGPTPDEISLGRENAFGGVARVARRDRAGTPNFLKPSKEGAPPAGPKDDDSTPDAVSRPEPPSPSSSGADLRTDDHVTSGRTGHDSTAAEALGQGLGTAIGLHAGGPIGGFIGGHLGRLTGRAASRGRAVLEGKRSIFGRNYKSLRNIERDANRLSKAVNKSFKKKH